MDLKYPVDTNSEYPTPPAWELYDLTRDPHEVNNVYKDPEYNEVVADLKSQFRALRARIKADDPPVSSDAGIQARMLACNRVIDEFWDYSGEDREKAVRISREYFQRFGDPNKCKKYLPPWLRPHNLDPSER